MPTAPTSKLFLALAIVGLGADAAWPIKTIDLTNNGADCDKSTEQYLQLEGHDYHDHPKFIMRWRQKTGLCEEGSYEFEINSWEASYDGSISSSEDDPPTAGDAGRVQLNLYVCAPFDKYILDMDIESYSDEASTLQKRTAWVIQNGHDQYPIWDTLNTNLFDDEAYSPTAPGEYSWPLRDATGYFSVLLAGPVPPLECASSVPSGTEYVGCFTDSVSQRLINSDALVLGDIGPDGMTVQICSDFCSGFDYFGLEYAIECFCGTAEEFKDNNVISDQCGLSYAYLCSGNATTACGGYSAISVYQRIQFTTIGCFQDAEATRIMVRKESASIMSAEICYELCNDGINAHFGTQYSIECWCAVDADLTKNGEVLEMDECDMPCAGTTSDEYCGGEFKMTAYSIEPDYIPGYLGCIPDSRFRDMIDMEKYVPGDMTNELCIAYCRGNGHSVAGTQDSVECWCGHISDFYGEPQESYCTSACEGDATQICGGKDAFSLYSTT